MQCITQPMVACQTICMPVCEPVERHVRIVERPVIVEQIVRVVKSEYEKVAEIEIKPEAKIDVKINEVVEEEVVV